MICLESVAFADGRYRLALTLKLVVEIERNCGTTDRDGVTRPKSIYTIHEEVGAGLALDGEQPVYLGGGASHANDIRQVIRCALIGGKAGMVADEEIEVGPQRADQLCDEYLFPHRPLIEGQYIAWAVLDACIRGASLKKKDADNPEKSEHSTGASSSPTADSSALTGSASPSANTPKPSKRTTRRTKKADSANRT